MSPQLINPSIFQNSSFVTPTGVTITGTLKEYTTYANMLADDQVPKFALVVDATGDPTVTSGSAMYVRDVINNQWRKFWEAESVDAIMNGIASSVDWNNIQNKPSSSTVDIDAAVTAKHTHDNGTIVDNLSEDESGNLTYNGTVLVTADTIGDINAVLDAINGEVL